MEGERGWRGRTSGAAATARGTHQKMIRPGAVPFLHSLERAVSTPNNITRSVLVCAFWSIF